MTDALDRLMAYGLGKRYTRRGLLKGGVAAGAGAVALSAFGGSFGPQEAGAAAAQLGSDLDILNYALTLEYLETEAYRAANAANILSGRAQTYFRAFGQHEAAHVDALTAAIRQLGGTPVARPSLDFSGVPRDAAAVVEFFQLVESVGAGAYLGAAPSIQSAAILEAALSIHAVEAEHAAALADLVAPGTDLFAPEAFATPLPPAEVLQAVAPFFAGQPTMPRTGGGFGAGRGGGEDRVIRR